MPLTFAEARHLLARTGFGGTPEDIRRLTSFTRADAVAHLLSRTTRRAATPPASWVQTLPPLHRHNQLPDAEKKAFREARRDEGLELKQWWYRELLTTPSPLTERMTLFWHNHFTSSLHKVKWPAFLYRQNVALRADALGSFADLLMTMAKDPAMLRYLDTQTSRKDQPNENFARELFELYTLGEGAYTEQDIKQAARAFTGWKVDPRTGYFHLNRKQEDTGLKTVFGRSGAWSGEDILSMTLARAEVAPYLVTKLWREFISETPDPREVTRLAGPFRTGGYRIAPLLQALFTSEAFWAAEHRGALIKSPVELLVGTARLFRHAHQDEVDDLLPLVHGGKRLGQDLFDPPNVKGWPGGTRWITTSTLLDRWQLVQRSLRGREPGGHNGPAMTAMADSQMARGPSHTGHATADWLQAEPDDVITQTLLPIAPVYPPTAGETRAQLVRHLVLDPTYQLK